MKIPAELKYTSEHEWVRIEDNIATVGITDYAQGELGDIVFVELPNLNDQFERGKSFGTIEAVKAVSDIYLPLSGKIVEINGNLDDDPMAINRDPYGEGWLVRIEMKDLSEIEQLLASGRYDQLISGQ